jgi:hypothetical protein
VPIVISRIGHESDGRSVYELMASGERIAVFKHDRADGLEVCLMTAALAAKTARDELSPPNPEASSSVVPGTATLEALRLSDEFPTSDDAISIAREAVGRLNVCVEIAARAVGRLDQLHDRCEDLKEDLRAAVEIAFARGAREWVQINYPKDYERLILMERARDA